MLLLPSELGGRQTSVVSNYHGAFYLDDVMTSAVMSFTTAPRLEPGQESVVDLDLLHPELFGRELGPGLQFQLREGRKTVGIGVLLES